jgi:hypothetical protein
MNQLPQFTTKLDIDGFGDLEIHFVHKRASRQESRYYSAMDGCTPHTTTEIV